jgi:choice-of-anchor A domain-containing protein
MHSLTSKALRWALLALISIGCNGSREESNGLSGDSRAIESSGSTCSSSRRPRLVTDREDYTTGLPVQLTGKGLSCGETYSLVITRPDGTTHTQQLAADSTGTVFGVFIFDSQLGNYEAELLNSSGTMVAHVHFHGSHFRYGHLTWRTVGPRKAEFSLVNAFRRDYPGSGPDGRVVTGDTFSESIGSTELCFGDGACTTTLTYEVISYDISQGWVIGRAISNGGTQTLPGTGVTVSETEPNNSIAAANSMNLGDDYDSNIATAGESDYVGFNVAQRTRVSIRTVLNGLVDSYLYLYNSAGQQLAANDDGGGGTSSLITIVLEPGRYYIRAAAYISYTGRQTVQLRQVTNVPPGPLTHTYYGDGPYMASISSCCRITNLSNPNENYTVQTPVRFNIANSSPVSGLPPIVNAPINKPDFAFQVPAVDAEGDQLTYRLATASESGIVQPIAGLTVSSTGRVSWSTVGKRLGQLWTTQIVIEERRNGQLIGASAVDFILRIVDSLGEPPQCVLPAQTSYTVNAGQQVQFTIGTEDLDSADTLTLNTGGLPPGATLTPALPLEGAPGISTTFNWTPSVAAAGSSHVVGFTVTDSTGQADQCSVSITVRAQPVNRAPVANAGADQSVLEGEVVTLSGSGSDPDGDTLSYGWSVVNSSGPAITLSDAASATPSFTTSDDGVYTLRFTVTDSHGATSSDTVTVTVGNVAPGVSAAGGDLQEGQTFSRSGSFTDPGADSWTATVDYGDGSGVQPLALNGQAFELSHPYADNGSFTVSISVTDDDGGVSTLTVPVVVSNVEPVVSATGGAVAEGSVFTSVGSFVDPGADTWTATVDYGDGTGQQPLALNGKSFTLSHTYTARGTYEVTVTVVDDDGGVGYTTVQVVVTDVCIEVELNDYNLFLTGDYNLGADVQGKVAAGGDITMNNFSVGWSLPETDLANTLVAGGNLTLSNGGVFGDAWYGGSLSADASVVFHRGAGAQQGTPVDFTARGNELRVLSSRLGALAANGTTAVESWGGILLTGSDPSVNVFTLNASAFTGATWLYIEAPAGSLAVINITGASASFSGFGHTFGGGIDQHGVLFNFVEATSITADGYGFWGTLLAPHADITFNNGSWDGGIYAKSLTGNAEGHINPLNEHTICR